MRDEVFKPFRSSNHCGAGIGLAFSRKVLEVHGGSIDLVSRASGACFRIDLPLNQTIAGARELASRMNMEETREISIVLINDQAIVRAAFKSLLLSVARFRVIGDAGEARQGIALVTDLHPDVVILDITMAGMSGLDAVAPIKRGSPGTKVLMVSQHEGMKFVRQALRAGADGYLSKGSEPEELNLAIDSIVRGDSYLSPKVASGFTACAVGGESAGADDASALAVLTPREREVFQLLALGKANKEVAAVLELSVGTVKKHRENLQRKLDCHSSAELARLAIREGLFDV
jgi:DNA-binding NarL/FixJ family response regulator